MTSDGGLTVVFTGHTGLEKRRVLDRLCEFIYSKDPDWCDLKDIPNQSFRETREKELAQVYGAEDILDSTFLTRPARDQQDLWRTTFLKALNRWKYEQPRPKFAFLSLHLTLQSHSQFFSPLAWRIPPDFEDTLVKHLSEDFRPRHCITLIDDVYTVQRRIREHGYNFRLIELLRWRNVEMMMTDLLAQHVIPNECRIEDRERYPFEHSPVIAVRHPTSMLHSFLLAPEIPRIYASYPISEPRRIAEKTGSNAPIQEINRFRSALHEKFTVFDPLSIDERPMQILMSKAPKFEEANLRSVIDEALSKSGKEGIDLAPELERSIKAHVGVNQSDEIVLRAANMWPGIECETLSGDDPTDARLSLNEVEEIATEIGEEGSEIDRQIRSRDYRMIDQADYIIVYRPTYCRKEWSGGTYHEVLYARAVGKRSIIIRDPESDGPLADPPFGLDLPPRDVFDKVRNLDLPENQAQVLSAVADDIAESAKDLATKGFRPVIS